MISRRKVECCRAEGHQKKTANTEAESNLNQSYDDVCLQIWVLV